MKIFIQKGFTKIAFTDHCPEKEEIDHRKNMRMKYSEKDEYLNSIKLLKYFYLDFNKNHSTNFEPGYYYNSRKFNITSFGCFSIF